MLNQTQIITSIKLIQKYLPNLFIYLTEDEFKRFILKSYQYTQENNGGSPQNNFIVTFFLLLQEHIDNNSSEIRDEFSYFNFLLGEFKKYGRPQRFKELIIAALNNFKHNNFNHILGEIAVCNELCQQFNFEKYEENLPNGKSIDFKFTDTNGQLILVDVYTIEYNKNRYEQQSFQKFIDRRIEEKFKEKTKDLELIEKEKIFIYPILHGTTLQIIKENSNYLINLKNSTIVDNGFKCFAPKQFGNYPTSINNVSGTMFNLMSIESIASFPIK